MPDELRRMGEDDARAFVREAAADGEKIQKVSTRDRIVEAVLGLDPVFWRDARGEAYATLSVDGRRERYRVGSHAFRDLVVLAYGDANPVAGRGGSRPGAPPSNALTEALNALKALALRGGVREPRPRVWQAGDGSVWLDLGREDWSLAHVTAEGWRLVASADVPLVRPPGLEPLSVPQCDPEALQKLGRLLNLGHGRDLLLICAWLVKALHPNGPNPVLALDGEQGSGKTTAAKMLRRLVDPSLADARAAPASERDLVIAASNGRLVVLDNVSSLDVKMSDALCRVATGGGWGERQFFTNGEEHIAQVCNPVLLNGIPNLLVRGDLADRAIAVTLAAIPDEDRRPEHEVWGEFDQAAPGIVALLLDGLAMALRERSRLHLPRRLRMADFAEVACAAAPALGATKEEMLAALEENRAEAVEVVFDADPLAGAIRKFALECGSWKGTATELLRELGKSVEHQEGRGQDWPKDATRLSNRLRRAIPVLRRAGVEVEQRRTNTERWIAIRSIV